MLKKGLILGVLACGVGLFLIGVGAKCYSEVAKEIYYDWHRKGAKKWHRKPLRK